MGSCGLGVDGRSQNEETKVESAGKVAASSSFECSSPVVLGLCKYSDGGDASEKVWGVSKEVHCFSYSDGSLREELRRGCVGDLQRVQEVRAG